MGVDDKDQYQKLLSLPGVIGVMVINQDGLAIRSSFPNEETVKYGAIAPLVVKVRDVMRELTASDDGLSEGRHGWRDPQDDLTFIKIRTMNHEILVSPCDNADFSMIALQRPLNVEVDEEAEETKEKAKVNKSDQ